MLSHETNGYKDMREKKTTLYLRSDDAYRARVSETIQKDSFFADVYLRANRLVNEITNTITSYEVGEVEVEIPRSMGNNVILFTADRGQGKTSAMNTFACLLKEGDSRKFFSGNSCLIDKKYEVLGIIDPTMMNQSESIVRVFLSRLFSQFEEKVREEEENEQSDSQSSTGQKRIKLLKLFSKCYDNINFLESGDKNYMEYNDLDSLARLGSSTELRTNIKELVSGYLDYVSCKGINAEGNQLARTETRDGAETTSSTETVNRFLVLQIDDADLSAGNIFAICEQIREYLRIPRVIVLMAADFSQLRNSVFQEYLTQYKSLIELQNRIEIVDTCYKKTWRYLEKMFPEGHRIYLPNLVDVLRNNPKDVIIKYSDVVKGIKIRLNNRLCSDVQEQLIWLIYDRTGIVFMKNERGIKSLFPETLRQLTQFIMEIGSMKSVDHSALLRDMFWPEDQKAEKRALQSIDTLQSNLERFYNYFFHEWVYSRVDKKVFIILKKIIKEEADTVKACRLIDDILEKPGLKDKEAEKKEEEQKAEKDSLINYDELNQSQGLKLLIEKSKRLEEKDNSYERLTEAISLYYSIKMNEWFLEMVKYGRNNRLLEFIDFPTLDREEGNNKEILPSYYHFRIDYKKKRRTLGAGGAAWAGIFFSGDSVTEAEDENQEINEFYNKTFDVWNPLYNIMKLIPDKESFKKVVSGICEDDRQNLLEWDMLLGIRLIVTNVDIRSHVISLLDKEKDAMEDNLPWIRRLERLYRTFDQWHDSCFEYLKLPESFHGLCNLARKDATLSSYLFLLNEKNYEWYCLAYARDIRTRYEKLISLIEDLIETSTIRNKADDGSMFRMDIINQKLWRINVPHDLFARTEFSELEELNEKMWILNNQVLDVVYGTLSDDTSKEKETDVPDEESIKKLREELSDNVKRLSEIEKKLLNSNEGKD